MTLQKSEIGERNYERSEIFLATHLSPNTPDTLKKSGKGERRAKDYERKKLFIATHLSPNAPETLQTCLYDLGHQ